MPNKTQPTNKTVLSVFQSISEKTQRHDCQKLLELYKKTLYETPIIWGDCIIGFGQYEYQYRSGRRGTWFVSGFAPRKHTLTLYLMCDLEHKMLPFEGLGIYKKGKGCLYIKKLEDVDLEKLKKLILAAAKLTREMWFTDE
jgi:hypothetical protein